MSRGGNEEQRGKEGGMVGGWVLSPHGLGRNGGEGRYSLLSSLDGGEERNSSLPSAWVRKVGGGGGRKENGSLLSDWAREGGGDMVLSPRDPYRTQEPLSLPPLSEFLWGRGGGDK